MSAVTATLAQPESVLLFKCECVELKPGETRHLQVLLNGRSFTYFDVASKQRHADGGHFDVLVGQSSQRTDLAGAIDLPRPIDLGLED